MAGSHRMLFLLSGNISTTPRAQKVIEYLEKSGVRIDLIMFSRGGHWHKLDQSYLSQHQIEHQYLPFSKKDGYMCWLASTVINLFSQKLGFRHGPSAAIASSKINAVFFLKNRFLRLNDYDAVFGFSSMLWPAYKISKRFGIPFAFDMEDYHPLENIYHRNKRREIKRREQMLIDLLPKATFVTYASPLIKQKADRLLLNNGQTVNHSTVLNNTFNASDFRFAECTNPKIQFVWFSQTVSFERGLEQILPALKAHQSNVHLTIIGNMDMKFYDSILLPYRDVITVKPAMPQNELHAELCKYDIGLAIEQSSQTHDNGNRELCLTNKIFSYLLGGLYIMATDTAAQCEFITSHSSHGITSGQTAEEMQKAVGWIVNNIATIRTAKKQRFEAASKFGWETEQNKLTNLMASL